MSFVQKKHYKILLCTLMLAASIVFCGCKKEGPQGQQGLQGDPGAQGPRGQQGTQGPAGNANVKTGTITLTNAAWLWASSWGLTTSIGSATIYTTRYVLINTKLVTADILATGTVLVYFKPYTYNDGWVPLPYRFLDATRNYYYNFVYDYKLGLIRLHYFWDSNGTTGSAPSGLGTYVLPTYTFKYVIIGGSTARQMQTARINTNDYDAVMQYLDRNE